MVWRNGYDIGLWEVIHLSVKLPRKATSLVGNDVMYCPTTPYEMLPCQSYIAP